jgi:replicative DNA helicase
MKILYEELPDYLQKNRKSIEGTVLGVLFQDIMSIKEYNLDDMFITHEGMVLYRIVKTLSDNNVLKATDLDIKLQCEPSLVKEYTDLGGFKMVEILMRTTELENANSYIDSLLKHNMLISFWEDGLNLEKEITITTKKGETQISWLDLADKMTTDELLNFKESRDTSYLPISINSDVKEHVGEISMDFIENLENGNEVGFLFENVLSSKFLPTISKEILGLRKRTLNFIASSINIGKSTLLSNLALSLASNGYRTLLMTNEEDISAFKIKFLTYLVNNEVGYKKINQKKIKSGGLTDEDKLALREARNIYNEKIADNLIIVSTNTMNMGSMKKIIRKYSLSSKGLDVFLFDTFKMSNGTDDDWKALVKQSREIHELTKIYDICAVMTYQLAMSNNGSLFLDIGMMANSKQIGEVASEMFLMRTLYKEELDKDSKAYCKPFKRVKKGDRWVEEEVELSPDSNYRVLFLGKSRSATVSSDSNTAFILHMNTYSTKISEVCFCHPVRMNINNINQQNNKFGKK